MKCLAKTLRADLPNERHSALTECYSCQANGGFVPYFNQTDRYKGVRTKFSQPVGKMPVLPVNERCPDCSSLLHHFRRGGSLVIRCSSPSCAWEVATTFPVPILRDHTDYNVTIPSLPDASPAMLIALNQRFTHGIPVTRELAIHGKLPPFVGSALETWHEAQRLRGAGIPFHIEPSYPFDLGLPSSAFGPPDGRIHDELANA